MMYLLDFDRTVFNTDAFIAYLRSHAVASAYTQMSEMELAASLDAAVARGELSFAQGELSQFLYEDAARFLRDKENGVMLITYGNKALQAAKVESALHGIPRITTIYTGEVRKGDFIAPYIGMYGTSPTFVDDSVVELEILSTRCPAARAFEMRRDGMVGDGRWSVITSFNEIV